MYVREARLFRGSSLCVKLDEHDGYRIDVDFDDQDITVNSPAGKVVEWYNWKRYDYAEFSYWED